MRAFLSVLIVGCALLFGSESAADTIVVEVFEGPGGALLRDAVVTSLKAEGYQVRPHGAQAIARVEGKAIRTRKKHKLSITLLSPRGETLANATFSKRNASALRRVVEKAAYRRLRVGVLRARAEAEERGIGEVENGSVDSMPDANEVATDHSAPRSGLLGWGAQAAFAMKTISRRFRYGGPLEDTEPRYSLPIVVAANLSGTYYVRKELGIAASVTFPRSFESNSGADTVFPSSTYALALGARYSLWRLTGALDYGNQSFSIDDVEGVDPGIPNVSYHYFRLGAGYWHPLNGDMSVGGSLGYRFVVGGGEFRSAAFYEDSSAHGVDLDLWGKYHYTKNTFLGAGLGIERYSHSMTAGSASDLFYSLWISVGANL